MSGGVDNIQATFHAKASEVFFIYYNDFEKRVVRCKPQKKGYLIKAPVTIASQSILSRNKEEK